VTTVASLCIQRRQVHPMHGSIMTLYGRYYQKHVCSYSHVSLTCDAHASTESKIVKQWFDFSGQLSSFGGADVLECSLFPGSFHCKVHLQC